MAKQGLSVHVAKFLAPEHNILPIYANRPIGRYPAAPVQNKTGTLERKYTGINANPQSGKSKSNMPIQKPLARQGLQNIKPNQVLNPPILHRPQGNDKLQGLSNAGNRNSPPGDSNHSRPGSASSKNAWIPRKGSLSTTKYWWSNTASKQCDWKVRFK